MSIDADVIPVIDSLIQAYKLNSVESKANNIKSDHDGSGR